MGRSSAQTAGLVTSRKGSSLITLILSLLASMMDVPSKFLLNCYSLWVKKMKSWERVLCPSYVEAMQPLITL